MQRRSEKEVWVDRLVKFALDRKYEEVVRLSSQEDVDAYIEERGRYDLFWFDALPDPVYHFWKLLKADSLLSPVHVVFTGIDAMDRGWVDLTKEFDSARFGKIVLTTGIIPIRPVVVPSQRGLFMHK